MKMKRAFGVVLGCVCLSAFGCSSTSSDPFGPTPDFGHVVAQFQAPSGTFAKGSESGVVSSLNAQKKTSSNGFSMGGAPSTSTQSVRGFQLQSLRTLDANGGTSWCAALQSGAESGSCSCPNGGSLQYDMSGMQQLQGYKGGPIDVTLKLRANACSAGGASIDGTEFMNMRSSGTPSAQDLTMLIDLHLTASVGGQTERLDADFEYDNGKYWFSITVDDGNVVVGSETWSSDTNSGTIVIKDKNETWTCTLTNGKGSCTSDHGGTRDVQ
jgi:hypothetical protein